MSGGRNVGALAWIRLYCPGSGQGVQKGWGYPKGVCGRGGWLLGPRVAVVLSG